MEEIVLWGTGSKAVKFLAEYDYSVKVIKCIQNGNTEGKSFMGVSVENAEVYLKKFQKGVKIILATNAYDEVKKQLDNEGLKEFSDYISSDFFGKKIAIVYGNCHIKPICDLLMTNKDFSEEYAIYSDYQIQVLKKNNISISNDVLNHCDLFIHQAIRENNVYGFEYSSNNIISYLPEKCKIISIPNLYRMGKCFFPQKLDTTIPDEKYGIFVRYSFRDAFIEQQIMNGKSTEEIAELIKNKNGIFDKAIIVKEFEKFIEKLLDREKEWDVKISDYILKNYKYEKLFYDPNHPCNNIFAKIAERILELMNFSSRVEKTYAFVLNGLEMPTYRDVIEALELQWDDDIIRTGGSGGRLDKRLIDCKEYVRQYRVFMKANKILDSYQNNK